MQTKCSVENSISNYFIILENHAKHSHKIFEYILQTHELSGFLLLHYSLGIQLCDENKVEH